MLWVSKIYVNMTDSLQFVDSPPLFSVVFRSDKNDEQASKFSLRVTAETGEETVWTFSVEEYDPAYIRLPEDFALQPHMRYAVSVCVWNVSKVYFSKSSERGRCASLFLVLQRV